MAWEIQPSELQIHTTTMQTGYGHQLSQLTIRVEYRDVVNDGIKVVWIQNLMDELEFHFKELVVVY